MTDFEPKILALCCHYCAYAAADLAGSMRLQYSPNVRVLRLPCTGKVDVDYMMKAFEKGVDGVIVAGCLEGGCHFQEGNLRAKKRVRLTKDVLAEAGIEGERLEMFNLSSAEGQTFAEIIELMTKRVKELGSNPLKAVVSGQSSVVSKNSPHPRPLPQAGEGESNTEVTHHESRVTEVSK